MWKGGLDGALSRPPRGVRGAGGVSGDRSQSAAERRPLAADRQARAHLFTARAARAGQTHRSRRSARAGVAVQCLGLVVRVLSRRASGVAPIGEAGRWVLQRGNPHTVSAFDEAGQAGIDYGVYGVPETYVIARDGVIRHKHIGPITVDVMRNEILPIVRKLKG